MSDMSFERPPMPTLERLHIPEVPEAEVWFTYARSGGPGGQNVNKRETKAVAHWHVDGSQAFTDEQKSMLHGKLPNRINGEGILMIDADDQRSQTQNRQNALDRLRQLVNEALTPQAERVATKPTYGSKQARMNEKTRQGSLKRQRQKRDWGDE